MSYFKALRRLMNVRTLVVALFFAAAVYYYYSCSDWVYHVAVSQEKELDLVAAMHRAIPEEGYDGEGKRFTFFRDSLENRDDRSLLLKAWPGSSFRLEAVPIHEEALLHLKYGVIEVQGEMLDTPVKFEVRAISAEQEKVILSEEMIPYGCGRLMQMESAVCDLGEFEDQIIDLVMRCYSVSKDFDDKILCGWERPRILSDGLREQLKNVFLRSEAVTYDFTRAEAKASPGPGSSWAIDPALTPCSDLSRPGSGSRPALVFYRDHQLDWSEITLSDEDSIQLRFSLGLQESPSATGGAEFCLRIDGREVFKEILAGGWLSRPWREHSLDLSEFRGETVRFSFAVKFRTGGDSGNPAPIAAFGHPRLVVSHPVRRSFTKRLEYNLVVLNIDSLRSDCLGCYGSPLGLTPFMDRLAESGLVFTDFVVASPDPRASVATLLTGLYPAVHETGTGRQSYLRDEVQTFPECLQQAGITTAAFIAQEELGRSTNINQGFETYAHLPGQNARKVNSLFDHWLLANSEIRFFAYLHYSDTQLPWNAPGGLRDRYVPDALRGRGYRVTETVEALRDGRDAGAESGESQEALAFLRGRYHGEVAYLDRRVEEVLTILEQYELVSSTVVVLTGCRGEEFMEHGRLGPGSQLHRESIQVPLILWGPKQLLGPHRMIEGMADSGSLFSSLAQLMNVPLEDSLAPDRGPSFFPLDERFGGRERFAFAETLTDRGRPLNAVMSWRHKMVRGEGLEMLFDLVADPRESRNLIGQGLPTESRLKREMEAVLKRIQQERGALVPASKGPPYVRQ